MPSLVALYDDALAGNPHFTRSTSSMTHSIRSLGVNENGVFVAEADGKTTGFAIVSISTEQAGLKQANVIELQAKDTSSMHKLIEALVDYSNRLAVDTVVVVQPLRVEENDVFKGWLKFDTGVMMSKALSLPSLVHALLSVDKIRNSFAGKEVLFHIGPETVAAKITTDGIDVADSMHELHQVAFEMFMSTETFLRLVFGRLNPYLANMTGMVRMKGLRNTFRMLKLLRMMRIDRPFYTSLGDRM